MAISLKKGEKVSLKKASFDLNQVTVGLGWDIAELKPGFFKKMLGGGDASEYDLDVVAFLCGADGKVKNLGDSGKGGDIVFYNSQKHPSGHIWLTGDNRTGDGDGDDEQIVVNLSGLHERYQKIVFIVQIYEGLKRKQTFSQVKSAFIRAVDRTGVEMVRFNLSGDATYSNCRSIVFAEFVREGDSWRFQAIGDPKEFDCFTKILAASYV